MGKDHSREEWQKTRVKRKEIKRKRKLEGKRKQ